MEIYLVGGAVRDGLLGLIGAQTDRDYVVVGGSVAQMLALGYRQVGKDFPVFLHPQTCEEYALARTERKTGSGYDGFVCAADGVSLESDLLRRDLTINAMARDANGGLIDPFGGRADLDNGLLRHVSSAFSEDPVRILRVARFAARFKPFGFKVAHKTHRLMQQMSAAGEVDALVGERVFKELARALAYQTPSAFFKVLLACGAYARLFALSGGYSAHHNAFEYLDNLARANAQIKFAVWLTRESVGAVDNVGAIKAVCRTLKCPKGYRDLARLSGQFAEFVRTFGERSPVAILDFLVRSDAFRRRERFADLLRVFEILGTDVSGISELRDQLSQLDFSALHIVKKTTVKVKHQTKNKTTDIATLIRAKRLQVIELFFHPTE